MRDAIPLKKAYKLLLNELILDCASYSNLLFCTSRMWKDFTFDLYGFRGVSLGMGQVLIAHELPATGMRYCPGALVALI
jgi:hypothetical protein